jgi:hypothetical protein
LDPDDPDPLRDELLLVEEPELTDREEDEEEERIDGELTDLEDRELFVL